MPDLTSTFAGVRAPNPFWLASAPPTNSAYQVHKAFEAGWGGIVWKTIGPPVLNISNRYGSLNVEGRRLAAINNVELISDRPLETNLREIAEVKREWPDRAVWVSAMVDADPNAWREIIQAIEQTGADGIELNYGCPQGMSERGMGSAVGQVPELCEMNTAWVREATDLPVIVKLTPNVTDIKVPALAALNAGADALSLINTINSITGVDLDSLHVVPDIGGRATHGGYAGPAVRPIALHMLSDLMLDPTIQSFGKPVSGIGGVVTWRDAAEFIALGASSVQVCTGAMHYGFRIVADLISGLANWMDEHGFRSIEDFRGGALAGLGGFNDLNLTYRAVARINASECIKCELCYEACEDSEHQCIDLVTGDGSLTTLALDPRISGTGVTATRPTPRVREEDCVGCGLCSNVCPVEGCIEMVDVPSSKSSITWAQISASRPEVTTDWDAMSDYRKEVGIHIH
jgi:dihydropyrimidine dehydrogenase (NAD+) subunit PreA